MKEKTFEELHLNRCNVQVEDAVKDWYMFKAKSMGMSMSQLMAFVLANWYENHITADAVRLLSELGKGEDLKQTNAEMAKLLEAIQRMSNSGDTPPTE